MFDRLFAHTQKERKNKNTIAKFENYILNILLKLILLLYQDQLKVSTHNKKHISKTTIIVIVIYKLV